MGNSNFEEWELIFIVNISTATLLVLARAWQRVGSQEAGSLNVSFSPSNVSQVTRFCHFCHKIRFSSLTEMKIGTSWGCGCALTSENCWIGEQTPSYICKARGPSGLLYTLSKEAFIRSFSQHCRDWCNSLSKFCGWSFGCTCSSCNLVLIWGIVAAVHSGNIDGT